MQPFYSPERLEEFRNLADAIEEVFPHMSRCVAYYRSLLDENRSFKPRLGSVSKYFAPFIF